MFNELIEKMSKLSQVAGIMLGGSRGSGLFDEDSDYDVYVYVYEPIDESIRKEIINQYVRYMEYSNTFWELEDDGILKNGIDIEFIYRNVFDIDKTLKSTLEGKVGNGYSTCFINNFNQARILYEDNKILSIIRSNLLQYDPQKMYDAVVLYNSKLLQDSMPSYVYQIEKAVKRNDVLSINHRLAAYFQTVYDILFALNKVTHPGEKRLLEFTAKLEILPTNFISDVEGIFHCVFQDNNKMIREIKELTKGIYQLIEQQGYTVTFNRYSNTQM